MGLVAAIIMSFQKNIKFAFRWYRQHDLSIQQTTLMIATFSYEKLLNLHYIYTEPTEISNIFCLYTRANIIRISVFEFNYNQRIEIMQIFESGNIHHNYLKFMLLEDSLHVKPSYLRCFKASITENPNIKQLRIV